MGVLLRLTQMAVGHLRPVRKGRRPFESNATCHENYEIKNLADYCLNNQYEKDPWYGNLSKVEVKNNVRTTFWKDVMLAWAEYGYIEPVNKEQILRQPLWVNCNIKPNPRNMLYNSKATEQGFNSVRDIITKKWCL